MSNNNQTPSDQEKGADAVGTVSSKVENAQGPKKGKPVSADDADALITKLRADVHFAVVAQIKASGLSRLELAKVLGESASRVSELTNNNVSHMSLEKLLRYYHRLGGKPRLELA